MLKVKLICLSKLLADHIDLLRFQPQKYILIFFEADSWPLNASVTA